MVWKTNNDLFQSYIPSNFVCQGLDSIRTILLFAFIVSIIEKENKRKTCLCLYISIATILFLLLFVNEAVQTLIKKRDYLSMLIELEGDTKKWLVASWFIEPKPIVINECFRNLGHTYCKTERQSEAVPPKLIILLY